ncbi:MAG: tRNA pseudouridine(38-40) synthase TruA, partial [Dehalococcoidia bacterium]
FVGGLNAYLPRTIAVRAIKEVEPGFDPRRMAEARRYRYVLVGGAVRSPLLSLRAWQVRPDLDQGLMHEVGESLVGERDFAAFAPPEASRRSTRREVFAFDIRRRGRTIELEIEANAFLMHQVRRTVATLVRVGSGKMTVKDFRRWLIEAAPGSFEAAAPPFGLYLLQVRYQPSIFTQEREQE